MTEYKITASKQYVIQSLKAAGFNVENKKRTSLVVDSAETGFVAIKVCTWTVSTESKISSVDALCSADVYILVRADDPENYRAYVYLTDEISRARPTRESPEGDLFTKDDGIKNPKNVGYWTGQGWKFCKGDRFEAWHLIGKSLPNSAACTAVNDISQIEIDNDDPQYREIISRVVIRDDEVRRRVIERAQGLCEYGAVQVPEKQCITFIKRNGKPYLEAHHVLKLADGGKDEDGNVIALCANHHREAHSGISWEALNEKFQTIIDEKLRK